MSTPEQEMAAPPLPPKGNSNSWLGDNRVSDQIRWRSENERPFSPNDLQGRSCLSDQVSNYFYTTTLRAQTRTPPLPPRPVGGIWSRPSFLTTELNELSQVPPPPGYVGQIIDLKDKDFTKM